MFRPPESFMKNSAARQEAVKQSSPSRQSSTHAEIEKIRLEREERRRKQAEVRKMNDGLSSKEKSLLIYQQLIHSYRQTLPPLSPSISSTHDKNSKASGRRLSENVSIWRKQLPDEMIKVVVRKRPLSAKEEDLKLIDIISTIHPSTLLVHEPKQALDLQHSVDTHTFKFDAIFDETASTQDIYSSCLLEMTKSFLSGGICTFMAYGQTGSGKTHTVFGSGSSKNNSQSSMGIVNLILTHAMKYKDEDCKLWISFYEIYGNKIYDLLNGKKSVQLLESKNGRLVVQGLKQVNVKSALECSKIIEIGMKTRVTAATEANPMSSRSHAILQLRLGDDMGTTTDGADICTNGGIFTIVDLAGSEKASETNARDKVTLMESAEINKSLLALKECIRALNSSASHVPFRGSKLTMLLRDSLESSQQDARKMVLMCSCICPTNEASEHTLNTLRYANRLKELHADPLNTSTLEDVDTSRLLQQEIYDDEEIQELEKIEADHKEVDGEMNMDRLMMEHLNCLQEMLQTSQKKEELWLESNAEELSNEEANAYVQDLQKTKDGADIHLEFEKISNSLLCNDTIGPFQLQLLDDFNSLVHHVEIGEILYGKYKLVCANDSGLNNGDYDTLISHILRHFIDSGPDIRLLTYRLFGSSLQNNAVAIEQAINPHLLGNNASLVEFVIWKLIDYPRYPDFSTDEVSSLIFSVSLLLSSPVSLSVLVSEWSADRIQEVSSLWGNGAPAQPHESEVVRPLPMLCEKFLTKETPVKIRSRMYVVLREVLINVHLEKTRNRMLEYFVFENGNKSIWNVVVDLKDTLLDEWKSLILAFLETASKSFVNLPQSHIVIQAIDIRTREAYTTWDGISCDNTPMLLYAHYCPIEIEDYQLIQHVKKWKAFYLK